MTERTCPSCDGAIDTGTICADCLANLHRDLDSINDAITELHTQLARQAHIGDNGGGARSAERPLPYDLPAPEPTCATCSEVEFLLLAGEAFEQIPGRLSPSVKRTSLERHLFRHRRTDLIRREVKW